MSLSRRASRPAADILEPLWLLGALLVPLWVNLWAQQPFDGSKILLLRSLVWLMAAIVLADVLMTGRLRLVLRRTPLLFPVTLLAGVYGAATLFSVDPGLSLWGSYDRAQGLLTLISYLLLFLVLVTRLRTEEQANRLLGTIVLSAVPIVLLGLTQAAGYDPICVRGTIGAHPRATASSWPRTDRDADLRGPYPGQTPGCAKRNGETGISNSVYESRLTLNRTPGGYVQHNNSIVCRRHRLTFVHSLIHAGEAVP